MNTYRSLSQLVGHTPLLEAVRYRELAELPANLFLKLESFNPAGSAKDRVALHMIETAEADGRLTPGGVIIEPTSGNTGIGLAAIGIARGYRVILTMPDSMSAERRALLAAYGAELVLTPGKDGMAGAIARAEELAAELPGVGTGGTVSGTPRYLKEQQTSVHIAAVEPAASPLLSGGKAGPPRSDGHRRELCAEEL